MEVIKIIGKSYDDNFAVYNLISYICRKDKTLDGLVGGFGISNISVNSTIEEFTTVKKVFNKMGGKQAHHIVISFGEFYDDSDAFLKSYKIAEYFRTSFQVCFAVHRDKMNTHSHFVVNSVSFTDGRKLDFGYSEQEKFKNFVKQIQD